MDDLISRQGAIYEVNSETVSTNPENFKSSEKFIKFMDDADIASFGKWQWANGFNTALVATTIHLKELPSARKQGKWIVVTRHEHYPSGKPYEQLQCPFCKRFDHNGDGSFCGYCGAELEVPKQN